MSKKVLRQSRVNRFIHWGTAISIILLIISGLGQLPLYKRYNITKLPGGEWLGSFYNTLDLHYIAAVLLIFVVSFHLVYHGLRREFDILPKKGDLRESYLIIKAMLTKGEEPPADKYLAEQRVAYFFIGINVLVLIGTGMVKVIKNLNGVTLPQFIIAFSTHLHNLATVLLILGIGAHLAAFIFKANRPLLRGIFSGTVDEKYAKERHPLWYKRIKMRI
ncbi:MAG: cytochrome b/b6 domain-containing protein [Peptococcaceae bacterium]|nr:cytochrome b/b6 domain-containing protein [Peptococcaceae bacterium]